MNLTEQYPLDVTKAGDSVKSAILKNRSEILGVMDSLNDQPAVWEMPEIACCLRIWLTTFTISFPAMA